MKIDGDEVIKQLDEIIKKLKASGKYNTCYDLIDLKFKIQGGYFAIKEDTKLRFADEAEKKGGWTISPDFLEDIKIKIENYDDAPSWEGIELVLLAHHGLPLPKVEEDTP